MSVQAKRTSISDLQERQQVSEVFLVSRSAVAETKNGRPYLALTLADRSGEIEARFWDRPDAADLAGDTARPGGFVQVEATAESYNGKLQLKLNALAAVDESGLDAAHFFPVSPRNAEEMAGELQERIKSVHNRQLRSLLSALFKGETLERFLLAPAAKRMHHAYQGGLVEHSLSVAALAEAVAAHYPALNRDLLLTGALLHDIAKIEEFTGPRPPIDYTDRGRLLGHLVMGVDMMRQAARKVKLPQDLENQVAHLILSHHGQLEFGSPVVPMTAEALILHQVDDMDAKMNFVGNLQAGLSPEAGLQWTAYQKPLNRFLYLQGASPIQPGKKDCERQEEGQQLELF